MTVPTRTTSDCPGPDDDPTTTPIPVTDDTPTPTDDAAPASDPIATLDDREGWHGEGYAARVHYRGEGDRYSIEYYAPSDCVLYWKVRGDGETAVPVGRDTVPGPLRERVRRDLAAAGVDPDAESRSL